MKRGDKVRDCYGRRHVVMDVDMLTNTVYFMDGTWAHVTKVFAEVGA
jgi:hypothetical protein